jgi:hypothetical protein
LQRSGAGLFAAVGSSSRLALCQSEQRLPRLPAVASRKRNPGNRGSHRFDRRRVGREQPPFAAIGSSLLAAVASSLFRSGREQASLQRSGVALDWPCASRSNDFLGYPPSLRVKEIPVTAEVIASTDAGSVGSSSFRCDWEQPLRSGREQPLPQRSGAASSAAVGISLFRSGRQQSLCSGCRAPRGSS